MERVTIEARRRWDLGKNGSHRLRETGWVPAVVYGKDTDPLPLAVEQAFMDRLLHNPEARNQICDLKVDDMKQLAVLVRDYQLDPIRGELIHVDLMVVNEQRVIKVKVPIETVGVPVGVKTAGGMLVVLVREVPIECLPQHIPAVIRLDVSGLDLNQSLRVRDLQLGDKVTILMDPEVNIAHVEETRAAVAEEAPAEGAAEAAAAGGEQEDEES
ncbi:MAG TPA: 50S ribosomal protein L25 [Acidobacteriota bacterium]|nr:50S ribosomal protein L25 [Acidobacteriota bacterium]HOT01882.1 50S ribosomal protein L25 [Acidobacteriota bacterium]HQF85836.1 50S ribosomal protein L25 [Acidobacteriota bacterium]HQG90920.1 50S ribosomal protein L25 [Acidobacteriota bacterium]